MTPEDAAYATVHPVPRLHYPAPWRVAEANSKGQITIVCEAGDYTCMAASPEVAQAIVIAVNKFAGVECE